MTTDPLELNRQLCDAANAGDADGVRTLLAAGADPGGYWDPARMRPDADGASFTLPPELANLELPPEVLAEMQRLEQDWSDSVNSGPSSYELPLFCAAESGDVETVRTLLDAGADPHRRDNDQRTALFRIGSAEAARLLVARGLGLEDRDGYDWTPLVHAIQDGSLARVEALLDAGADVNATWDRGYTVFMGAASASERDPAVLRALAARGADVHAVTDLGYNAFHTAVDVNGEANEAESVRGALRCLHELGVALESENASGHTPLARAVAAGTAVEVRVLCELGADPDVATSILDCGAEEGDEEEEACSTVRVPLIFAAIDAAVEAADKLEALLAAGVRLDVTDHQGRSPLAFARDHREDVRSSDDEEYRDGWLADAERCVAMLET